MTLEDGRMKICYQDEDLKVSRVRMEGLYDHYWEIEEDEEVCIPKIMENQEWLEEQLKKYKNFDETIAIWRNRNDVGYRCQRNAPEFL